MGIFVSDANLENRVQSKSWKPCLLFGGDLKDFFKKYLLGTYAFLFVVAGILVALDQWTKSLVRNNLAMGTMWSPWDWLMPYARIVHWSNTGVAFGMFQNQNELFALLAFIVSIVIIYYFPRVSPNDWIIRLALGIQLGGAVGNLIDRVLIGHVTDFVSVGSFAVFNVADASITVGVIVLLLGIWIQDRRQQKLELTLKAVQENNEEVAETDAVQPPADQDTQS
jgi:signal peptidase II